MDLRVLGRGNTWIILQPACCRGTVAIPHCCGLATVRFNPAVRGKHWLKCTVALLPTSMGEQRLFFDIVEMSFSAAHEHEGSTKRWNIALFEITSTRGQGDTAVALTSQPTSMRIQAKIRCTSILSFPAAHEHEGSRSRVDLLRNQKRSKTPAAVGITGLLPWGSGSGFGGSGRGHFWGYDSFLYSFFIYFFIYF